MVEWLIFLLLETRFGSALSVQCACRLYTSLGSWGLDRRLSGKNPDPAAIVDNVSVFFPLANICRQPIGVVDLNMIIRERHEAARLKVIQDTIGVIS